MSILASDNVKYQYLYFVACVVSNQPFDGLDCSFYYSITKDLLINHKRYVEYLQKLQRLHSTTYQELVNKVNHYRTDKIEVKPQSDHKYLLQAENDYLRLLERIQPLDSFQITELLKHAEYT